MKFSTCKLCKEQKELKKSHVIPRAVFKTVFKNFNYGCVLDREHNKVINSQDQWSTYLLCADCEHKLNVNYEQYSLNVLRKKDKYSKYQEFQNYVQISNVEQRRLILFIISMLWRALESNHVIFKNLTDLGVSEEIKELLRKCVEGGVLPNTNFFSVKVSKLVNTIEEYRNIDLNFVSNFECKNVDNMRIRFLIMMESFCFEIFLHTNPNDYLIDIGVLRKNKRILKLPLIEAFLMPEFQKSIDSIRKAQMSN